MPGIHGATTGYSQSIAGGSGDDTLTSGFGADTLDGGGGNDSLVGTGWGNQLLGGQGDDRLDGGQGNATLAGGDGNNWLYIAGYNDSISAGTGDNTVSGTDGNATILLGTGANQVTLSGWSNRVTTGDGADSITLVAGGNATIGTGGGDDLVALGAGGGDSVDAGPGTDTITYSGAAGSYTVHDNGDGTTSVSGPGGTDTLRHVETLHFVGGGADLHPGNPVPPGSGAGPATNLMLFTADDGSHGTELWASDGTAAGTRLVLDLTPGAAGSAILGLVGLGQVALFATEQDFPANGPVPPTAVLSIWQTDGTSAGTQVLTTLATAPQGGHWVGGLDTLPGDRALFIASGVVGDRLYGLDLGCATPVLLDGAFGSIHLHIAGGRGFYPNGIVQQIIFTDGTLAGTGHISGVENGSYAAVGSGLVAYGGAPAAGQPIQLQGFDLASNTSHLIATINPGGSAAIADLTSFGSGQALFSADDGSHGSELWITDGTAAGTRMVADIWTGGIGSSPANITDLGNGKAVLSAHDAPFVDDLVCTDGTAGGTSRMVLGGSIGEMVALGDGTAVFTTLGPSTDPVYFKLWVTDGTVAGTHVLFDATGLSFGFGPHDLRAIGTGRALFAARDLPAGGPGPASAHGDELWVTDGTVAGTHMVTDINPGTAYSAPAQLAAIAYTAPLPPAPIVATGYGQHLGGSSGADTLTSAFGGATLDGGAGDDTIGAAGWGNHLLGGLGNDSLDGGAGNGTIEAGGGDNLVLAAGWSDSITAGDGADHITLAIGGNATIDAGDGANLVSASGWSDSITSGSGDDLLSLTSGGNASIASGGGQDSIALGLGGGDLVDAGSGNDTVSYSGQAVDYRIQRNTDGSLEVSGPGGTDHLSHVEQLRFADGHFDPGAPTHGDLNGDHRADPVLQNVNGDVWTLLSTGGASEIFFDHQGFVARFVGDIGGDGGLEVLYQNPSDGALRLQRTTGGAPLSQGGPGSFGASHQAVGLADFNGDGRDDVLLRDAASGAISVEQVNPDFSGTPLQLAGNPGLGWSVVGTGDLSGDGRADILFHASGGGYWLWQMNGAAIGPQGGIADPGGTWQVKAIADVNGDNHADLIWQDAGGNLDIWEMSGTTVLATGYLGSTGSWWTLVGAMDLSGDGRADLIFQGQDGTLWDWTLNGLQITGGGSLAAPGAGWHLVA